MTPHGVGFVHALGCDGFERISLARGPPLWDDCDAQVDEGVEVELEPDWDLAAQPAPDYGVDQRDNW